MSRHIRRRRARALLGACGATAMVGALAAAGSTATATTFPLPPPSAASCDPPLGAVGSWGSDGSGELGNGAVGSAFNRAVPGGVARAAEGGPLTAISSIAMGPGHALAVTATGSVLAWVVQTGSPYPLPVAGVGGTGTLTSVTAVASGGGHSLALLHDHTVAAWGSDFRGQLGNGSNVYSAVPVLVSGLTNALAIAAGGTHSLALRSDGSVVAWGDNSRGQLGTGSAGGTSNVPVSVPGLTGVMAIAAGQAHSLALRSDGSVLAWGAGDNGQLGNGLTSDSPTPVLVQGIGGVGALTGVTAVAAGQFHSLALRQDGSVADWGFNGGGSGWLGTGSGDTIDAVPAVVTAAGGTGQLGGAVAIAAGAFHSVALESDSSVLSWGDNGAGELGDGTTMARTAPVGAVSPAGSGRLTGVTAISAGGSATLIISSHSLGSVAAAAGTPQNAGQETTFATPLRVAVTGADGRGVPDVPVNFTAPLAGPSGTFAVPGGNPVVVSTDGSGVATAPAFTANQTAGTYSVVATSTQHSFGIRFSLTNAPLAPGSPLLVSTAGGTPQTVSGGRAASTLLQAVVTTVGPGVTVESVPAPVSPSETTIAGTSIPVPDQSVTFTVSAAGNGASASFGSSVTATAITDGTGIATAPPLIANLTAGSYTVSATTGEGGTTGTFLLTNTPLGVGACAGTPQSAATGEPFATPFGAIVENSTGRPVAGVPVTFSAPTAGPAGGFSGGATATVLTDPGGMASSPTFTANGTLGSYTVLATVPGAPGAATFAASNVTASTGTPDLALSVSGPTGQTAVAGTATTYPLAMHRIAGFSGPVHLAVSGLPGGAAGAFSPNDTAGSASSLSVTTSVTTPSGGYPLLITGTSGGLSRSTSVRLWIMPRTLSGDSSALFLQGVTLAGRQLPSGGQGLCEAGPVSTTESGSTTGGGTTGCGSATSIAGVAVAAATETVTTQSAASGNPGSSARSTAAAISLLPGALPGGLDVLDASSLDSRSSAVCGHPPASSSSIGRLTIAGQTVATRPVGSRIIFNPTGKDRLTLYGSPTSINPTGARRPMAVVTLNYSRYDPATGTQVGSPLEVEFPAGGALSSVIVGQVFLSYARAACT